VVQNEKKKYRLGESTLIDVIIAQDRLDSALLSHVQNRQTYATQLARLRLQTGTLLTFDNQQAAVDVFRFTTLPGDIGTD
jgi:outer membrane protein TolC